MIKIYTHSLKIVEFFSKFFILNKIFVPSFESLEKCTDKIFHSQCCNLIFNSNNTSKMTYSNRFNILNLYMSSLFDSFSANKFCDLAVSNGITSIELINLIKTNNNSLENFTAIDLFSKIHRYDLTKFCSFYCDSSNKLLGCVLFNFLYISRKVSSFFIFSKILGIIFTFIYEFFLLKTNIKLNLVEISLLFPEFRKLCTSGDVDFLEIDFLSSEFNNFNIRDFHFVRCMNFLNLVYFDKSLILIGLKNILKITRNDSIVLIGRTDLNGDNNASFFKINDGKFLLLKDFGLGSEIKPILIMYNLM